MKENYPIGTKLTIVYSYSGMEMPYTVIGYDKGAMLIQECALIFNGPRYFDTLADDIRENLNGRIERLHWAPKRGNWQKSKYTYVRFGSWNYYPNLD